MGRKLINPVYFNDIGLDNIVPVKLGGTGAPSADLASSTLSFVSRSMVGAINGVASLDANGLVPLTQIPNAVYDVIEVSSYSTLPATGTSSKIYVTQDTSLLYRWNGSGYVQLNTTVGSSSTAVKLTTPRKINGTNFDGSADITTASWGTARTITIGATGKSVNGSTDVSWSLSEIGAAPATHTHTLANITDFTITSPATGQFFRYNGSKWVNTTLSAGDIPALDASKITTGTIATGLLSGTYSISISGNAATATKLATARTINGTSFDGSANITTASWGTGRTITIGSTAKTVDGSADVSWSLTDVGAAAANHTHTLIDLTDTTITTPAAGQFIRYNGTKWVNTTLTAADIPSLDANKITSGTIASALLSGTYAISISGNAATATKLATARSINGTNFDGTGNITTANWGTARTITIGTTGKTVDGSANISWSLTEIGAAAASHTHTLSNITDFVITSPATGHFFRYNGTNWVNTTLTAADIPPLDASKITTGSVADAQLSNTFIEKMTVINFFASL